jgi:hypothetical protein
MSEGKLITVRGREYWHTDITGSPTLFDLEQHAFEVFKHRSRRAYGVAVAYRVSAVEIPVIDLEVANTLFLTHASGPHRRSIIRIGISFINENKDRYTPALLREQTEPRMESVDDSFRAVLYDDSADTPVKAAIRALQRMSWAKMHKHHVPLLSGIGHLIRWYGKPGVCVGWQELRAGKNRCADNLVCDVGESQVRRTLAEPTSR